MKELKLKVDEESVGKRLDLFLSFSQQEVSRSAIKKLIKIDKVEVNKVIENRANYKLKLGDEVVVFELDSVKQGEIKLKAQDIPLDIIYEDKNLLVVNKPEGMVVHPATGNEDNTLMNAVLYHYKTQDSVGDNLRSGLIHRLDKDTSGLVMIGKTNKGLWYFSKQFAERKVKKTYLAVVRGDFFKITGKKKIEIKNFIGRNPKERKKMTTMDEINGKLAITTVYVKNTLVKNNNKYTLLEIKPTTGRTHQIRVHLSQLGFSILGDRIYGSKNRYKRLMLHARSLEVENIDGKNHLFEAPIPYEFTKYEE